MDLLWNEVGEWMETLVITRGTGMIAGSSTFRPHLGKVIRDLFRLLNAVYGIVRKH